MTTLLLIAIALLVVAVLVRPLHPPTIGTSRPTYDRKHYPKGRHHDD